VLDSEHEPRLTPGARRRLRLGSAVVIVSILSFAGGMQVQERRLSGARGSEGSVTKDALPSRTGSASAAPEAAAQAPRPSALPELSAAGPHWFDLEEAEPPAPLSIVMTMGITLRNEGPRDVTVYHASAGGFVLLEHVQLSARTAREVILRQHLQCSADTPLPAELPDTGSTGTLPWPGPLVITASTLGGPETITLDEPPYYTDHAAGNCKWVRDGRPATLGGPPTIVVPR
jgi:hypothetical protein